MSKNMNENQRDTEHRPDEGKQVQQELERQLREFGDTMSDEFRHGIGVRAGGIEHGDALFGALIQRDIIDARPGTRDAQQFRVQRRIVHDR